MNDTGVIAKPRRVLDGHFPGQRFAVFYREGDGPDRDVTATIPLFDKETCIPASIVGDEIEDYQQYHEGSLASGNLGCRRIDADFGSGEASRVDVGSEVAGSAEFLRVEVAGRGHPVGFGSNPPPAAVTLWAVGRVSLRVEAKSFDEPLGEDRQAAAKTAFVASWASKMQVRDETVVYLTGVPFKLFRTYCSCYE